MRTLIIMAALATLTAHAETPCYGYGCDNGNSGIQVPAYQPEPDPTPAEVQPLYPTAGQSCNYSTDCSPGERCLKHTLDYTGTCH